MNVLDYLMLHEDQNAPALNALKRGAEIVVCSEGGAVLFEQANDLYFVSADDNALIDGLWRDEKKNVEVLALRERNIDAAAKRIGAKHIMKCRQMVFSGEAPIARPVEGLSIAPFTAADIDFVCAHYAMAHDRTYLLERLENGRIYGAYMHGEPSGFVGRHDDGSMGMLEVLPKFKRLGIGTALACFIIGVVLSTGETPYAHILLDNAASLAMTGRIPGAVILNEAVAWIY